LGGVDKYKKLAREQTDRQARKQRTRVTRCELQIGVKTIVLLYIIRCVK